MHVTTCCHTSFILKHHKHDEHTPNPSHMQLCNWARRKGHSKGLHVRGPMQGVILWAVP